MDIQTDPKRLFRGRRYWLEGWRTWYEPCPVIKSTERFLTVSSETFENSPLYKGGSFRLSRKIMQSGKEYHSRHGEHFFLEPQPNAYLFPSKDVLGMPSFATIEATQKGWAESRSDWAQWQRDCWIIAKLLERPLQSIVDEWKLGGESALDNLFGEIRLKNTFVWPQK